eukprot:Hpha_TRINITY_DN33931_c0_g1::TRINITY_DN33931_c0_g1_i1::g.69369::m.69369
MRPFPTLRKIAWGAGHVGVWEWSARPRVSKTVVLVHATGLHARVWDVVVQRLPEDWRCLCIDLPGHGRSDVPGPEHYKSGEFMEWFAMRDAVSVAVGACNVEPSNTLLVGHSIGGYMTLRVAADRLRKGAKFAGLLLLDPVIFDTSTYIEGGFRDPAVSNLVGKRRAGFGSVAEMLERFSSRPPYNTWDKEALRSYCEHGVSEVGADGLCRLRCPPLTEVSVYHASRRLANSPHEDIAQVKRAGIPVTTVLARPNPPGEPFGGSPTWLGLPAAVGGELVQLGQDRGHFIPQDDPAGTVAYIMDLTTRATPSRL